MHNPTYQGWWNTFNILGITERLYVIDIKKLSSGKDWVFTADTVFVGFPDGISGKQPTCQCRRLKRPGFDSWVGRSPGGGHSNQLQYSCLENPMDRGAWQVTVHRVPKSWTRLNRLSTHAGSVFLSLRNILWTNFLIYKMEVIIILHRIVLRIKCDNSCRPFQ